MKTAMHALVATVALALSASLLLPRKAAAENPSQEDRLLSLINRYSDSKMRLDPFLAGRYGIEEDLGKFSDFPSVAFQAREKTLILTSLVELKAVRKERLTEDARRLHLLFEEHLHSELERLAFPNILVDFNQMGGRLQKYLEDTSPTLTSFPFDSVAHYEAFLSRSEGFPVYLRELRQALKREMDKGFMLSCVAAEATRKSYQVGLEGVAERHPFYRPVEFMPDRFSSADRGTLKTRFHRLVTEVILPAFQDFDSFFRTEYLPHCRQTYGIGALPGGKAWYAERIRNQTGLDLSARQIHQIGLKEVERITAEENRIREGLGFAGSLRDFLGSVASDPKYTFKSMTETFQAFERTRAQVAAKIPAYFSLAPKSDYRIVESSNPQAAAAMYFRPSENLPYGRLVVPTKNLRAVPTYIVNTLSLHETIPGHHFQLALQFELKAHLSSFQRKLFVNNAFIEGWALYAEHLGREMGMYSDPMQQLGNLDQEMLRAVRLVVDTGIHSLGWSRVQTLDYMRHHVSLDEETIAKEADRYSVWPGQALSYKMGQLKILELRRLAEKELGDRFDLKSFHQAVIGNGTISLKVLEMQIRDWIRHQKRS